MRIGYARISTEGFPIEPEDVARLSPLVFDHINLLGRYAWRAAQSRGSGS